MVCNAGFHGVFCKTTIIRQLRRFHFLYCLMIVVLQKLHETQGRRLFSMDYIYIYMCVYNIYLFMYIYIYIYIYI